jgi:hypothetical protein
MKKRLAKAALSSIEPDFSVVVVALFAVTFSNISTLNLNWWLSILVVTGMWIAAMLIQGFFNGLLKRKKSA